MVPACTNVSKKQYFKVILIIHGTSIVLFILAV